ncbi:MAG: hypothetical protein LBT97_08350, partial [Planctomycetota bacterium]|nr:hypothetical protein [Planctomycetota bacterium]
MRKATSPHRQRKAQGNLARSENQGTYRSTMRGNREVPAFSYGVAAGERVGKSKRTHPGDVRRREVGHLRSTVEAGEQWNRRNTVMAENPRPEAREQENPRTGGPRGPTESVEGRGVAKRNPTQGDTSRMQGRNDVQQALARVRQAARRDKSMRFTALLHHVYNPGLLREAYFALKRDASAGVDGETWRSYG